ncbi:MAG: helix-turn-helix transcriptional regulator [Dehalococcoidia bacterium]
MEAATRLTSWREIEEQRLHSPEARTSYDRARRAYELGRQVRELRTRADLSQKELALLAGATQAGIARIEAGDVLPTIDSLDRIGRALGVDLLVCFQAPTPPAPV